MSSYGSKWVCGCKAKRNLWKDGHQMQEDRQKGNKGEDEDKGELQECMKPHAGDIVSE